MKLVKEKETAYWKQQFDLCKSLREPYEKQWYLNLAFYSGKQYVSWSPTSGANLSTQRLQEPPAPRYRVRLVANKIKPAIRTELTKLIKEEPQFYSVPATPEPSDVAAAKAGEAIVEFLLPEVEFNRVRRKATWWALICGTAFEKTYAVPRKEIAPPPMFSMEPPKHQFENNIRLDAVTAFHIYVPNLQEEDLEKQPYVIHVRSYSSDEIKAVYGVTVAPKERTAGSQLDQKFKAALGIKAPTQAAPDMCLVKEIWVKPCAKYQEGALLVYAEDTLVYSAEPKAERDETEELTAEYTNTSFPYEHGKFPYDKIEHVPSGSFYSTSIIDDLISLQKEYNRTRSQIVEAKNRMGNPQMTYVKGSIDPKKVTSEPGLMIPVNPGFEPPRPVEMVGIPGYVIQELDRTLRDMDDLTGQYEVSKGRTPPGVEAASAIAYLQEENDSKLYHTVASIEEATRGIGRKMLALVRQFWTEEDIVYIISKNSSFEASMFKAANMAQNSDIRVEPGSMAPKSKAATQAFITDLMAQGFIPPEKGLRYLQMNETNRLYEELQSDAKAAQRENYRMAKGETNGEPLPVNIWDNTPVHLNEHGLFLKSQEYELLPEELKQVHIIHYVMHKQAELGEQFNVGSGIPGATDNASDPGAGDPSQQQFPGIG